MSGGFVLEPFNYKGQNRRSMQPILQFNHCKFSFISIGYLPPILHCQIDDKINEQNLPRPKKYIIWISEDL